MFINKYDKFSFFSHLLYNENICSIKKVGKNNIYEVNEKYIIDCKENVVYNVKKSVLLNSKNKKLDRSIPFYDKSKSSERTIDDVLMMYLVYSSRTY